jgi:PhzF family phenazine biosynthesis protein
MRAMQIVDVFASAPYGGNPVAVVLDGEGLTSEQMRRFAHWMNLSETTFLLPANDPVADYRLRIFTPVAELPFAGHPTLGSCHAWLQTGAPPKRPDLVTQECPAGLIGLRRIEGRLAFAAPALTRTGPVEEPLLARIASVLGIAREEIRDSQWVDNGPGWVAVMLAGAEQVLALRPGLVEGALGIIGPYPAGAPEAFEVRAFFAKDGSTVEDPVTGSLNASLAQWLLGAGRASAPYVVSQGTALGRAGRVHICSDEDGAIWVGGATVTRVTGQVEL